MSFRLLGIHDVADRLQVTPDRVRQLDAELKPVRINRRTRVYHSGLVDAYLDERAAKKAARVNAR